MNNLMVILYAEDDARDIELTLSAFRQCRFSNEIAVVRDGQEALDFLSRRGTYALRSTGNPAFVLLDLKMPKVDGVEVLRRMKGDASLRTIPVVMLTSSREENDVVESYKLGVNAYVVKPIDFQEFTRAVREIGVFWAVINEPPPSSVGSGP
jgi:CheY-like chemotaxis protein